MLCAVFNIVDEHMTMLYFHTYPIQTYQAELYVVTTLILSHFLYN